MFSCQLSSQDQICALCRYWGTLLFIGGKAVCGSTQCHQLGFPREVATEEWIGILSMLWHRVLPEVHHFARMNKVPDILVLHVKGNDLAVQSMRHFAGI